MAAQLEELDAALLRFSTGANRRVSDAVGFDASALVRRACAPRCETAVETPEYPGRKFIVQCADLASAVATLARGDGRMLGALAWRGTVVDRAMARWRPDQYVEISARQVARGNPWAGLPGCIYMGFSAPDADVAMPEYFVAGARGVAARACATSRRCWASPRPIARRRAPVGISGEATADMPADDERWNVPPSLAVMLQPLATLQRPTGSLYRMYTDARPRPARRRPSYRYGPNRIDVGGTPIDVGFSIDLTIEPAVQALAQKTAACYTGRQDVCRALGLAAQRRRGARDRPSDARARGGPDGGDRDHRYRERPHRSAGGRAVAVHAPGIRRAGPRRRLRQAAAVSDSLSPRCAAQSRRLSRRDAGVGHQADHGRGLPVRSRCRRALARRRAGGMRSARARRRSTACAAS